MNHEIVDRNVSVDKRVWAMGITAAAGSFGQFLMLPVEQGLLSSIGANYALLVLVLMASLMIPIAFMLREPNTANADQESSQTIKHTSQEAMSNPSFGLLTLGYLFVDFR